MIRHLFCLSYIVCFICTGCSTKSIVHQRSLILTEDTAIYSDDDWSIIIEAGSDDKDLQSPQPIEQINPIYPEEAKKQGIEGEVQIKILVMNDGCTKRGKVLKTTNQIFNKAALSAGMQWSFKPAEVRGRKINAWVLIPFKYRLDN
ncbi:MAG: energy transducer TonB [Bacteroidetes bacterium]|nr:energy transducer TonB [Bacteroidota bacterium]